MYHNHIPHNQRPLEDLLNGKMQRSYSHNPEQAGLRWAGHDAQANSAILVSHNALPVSHLRTLLTEDVSLLALLVSQIRDYHKLQVGYDDTSAWLSPSGKRPRPRTNPTGLYLPSKARSSVLLTVGPKGSGACPTYVGEYGRPTHRAERILDYGLDRAVNGQYGNRFPR